jgi:hypothetical protein
MKNFIGVFICLFLWNVTFSQGVVRGKITDENGETVIGAAVVLKSNKSFGVMSDFDGNYSLSIKDSIAQTIVISFIGYTTIEELIVFNKAGEVQIRNYKLSSKQNEIKQFEVFSTAVKNKDYYLENLKKKSSASIDYISSETMKKTGDNNVTAAISRVSGVSTNGSFITVRGIGDRYLKTNINGMRIPTLDPFTNNIKLDLFPSSLVDNIIITKTASPDLPGDWAGAYISIETKDYPDKLTVNIESQFGYNAQTTGKDMLTSERSQTDWLGFDNGLRNIDHNSFVQVNVNPTQYQEFVALGLGDYLQSIGVTENSAWNDTYYKLSLVQLGLLAKGQFYDAAAVMAAKEAYTSGDYKGNAFAIINENAAASSQKFKNNWDTKTRKGPMNFSQSFSIGNQVLLFGKPLGFLTGFRYGSSFQNDPNSVVERAGTDANGNVFVPTLINQHVSREMNGWSGLINLSYKFAKNHSASFLFMPNFNGANNVRIDSEFDNSFAYQYRFSKTQFYEERRQMVYQFKTEHYIPKSKIKIESNVSYTRGKSSAPDFKNYDYFLSNDNEYVIDRTGSFTSRFYRYLTENLFDSRVFAEIPLGDKPLLVRKIKIGGGYQRNDRTNDQYNYIAKWTIPGNYVIQNNDISPFFALSDFAINNNSIKAYYERDENPANRNIGFSQITNGFAMTDYSINYRWRIAGGLRVESAQIFTDVYEYDSLGYAANDGRRFFTNGIIPLAPNPGNLENFHLLPSANVIFKIKAEDDAPMNLRFNFSKTVARPSIREISEVIVPDFELRANVFGNSDLKTVEIMNYDLRLENYFKSGENVSFSVFYKDFKNHIELTNSSFGFSWQNIDQSVAYGIELEGRKKIFKNLDFKGNVTITNSSSTFTPTTLLLDGGVKTYVPLPEVTRAMFGQAPYVLNGMLNYNSDTLGLAATISYNRQGRRLVIANGFTIPDVYEIPRDLVDVKISKNLGKHFIVSFTIRDLLNSPIVRTYNFDEGEPIDFDRFRYGTIYQFGIQYKL